jgi:hypothetical protein
MMGDIVNDGFAAPAERPATPPAGWYPDPWAPGASRFWDGAAWSPHTTVPQHAAAAPGSWGEPVRTPDVDTNTVWTWLIVLLPLVSIAPLLFIPWDSLLDYSDMLDPTRPSTAPLGVYSSPLLLLLNLLSYVVLGLTVWFAFLDRRELLRRGIDRPFPWPWVFLSVVYPIGRAVVSIRRTGRGAAPIWGVTIVTLIGWIVGGIAIWTMLDGAFQMFGELMRVAEMSSR